MTGHSVNYVGIFVCLVFNVCYQEEFPTRIFFGDPNSKIWWQKVELRKEAQVCYPRGKLWTLPSEQGKALREVSI